MKFKAKKQDFQNALAITSKVTPTRSTLQILNTILIHASDNTICLRSSDLEMSISTIFQGDVIESGSVAAEGKFLLQFISETPFDEIEIQSDNNNNVAVHTQVGDYDLGGQNPDEFPSTISVDNSSVITISADLLFKIISNTTYIASKEEMKPSLSGVFLRFVDGNVTGVCTDGHRLVKYTVKDKSIKGYTGDILVPAKYLNLIAGFLQNEKEIDLRIGEKFIACKIGNSEFVSRLISERYPDFEAVIPTNNEKYFLTSTHELLSSVRRTSLFANRNNHQIAFHLTNGHLSIETNNSEMQRSAAESLEVSYSDSEMKIGYNCLYLKEMLQHLKTDSVKFLFSTAIGATLISPEKNKKDEELILLIMPIRLSD